MSAGFFGLTSVHASECGYEKLQGSEFSLTDMSKKYVLNSFFVDPNKDIFAGIQRNEKNYESLKNNKFKVVETGVLTSTNEKRLLPTRYSEFVINNKSYVHDRALASKLLTSDCKTYYLSGGLTLRPESTQFMFLKADGSKADEGSYIELFGSALKQKDTSASVIFDRFEKIVNIKTKDFDNMLLRGTYNPTTKKLLTSQLYLNTSFIGKWGNIQIAYDTDGNTHEVVKIDRDAECSNRYMDCKLSEIVGVSLSEPFLRKNKNGFELKLKGQQDRIIKVPSDMVVSFLDGLDAAKKKY
ncbi:hypothetical protein F982_00399 [Acinetobacter baumannii NIPH 1362]|nr:hypothetical protein F982_00399 [Acinetobacter baumannii NIPH 1362]